MSATKYAKWAEGMDKVFNVQKQLQDNPNKVPTISHPIHKPLDPTKYMPVTPDPEGTPGLSKRHYPKEVPGNNDYLPTSPRQNSLDGQKSDIDNQSNLMYAGIIAAAIFVYINLQ